MDGVFGGSSMGGRREGEGRTSGESGCCRRRRRCRCRCRHRHCDQSPWESISKAIMEIVIGEASDNNNDDDNDDNDDGRYHGIVVRRSRGDELDNDDVELGDTRYLLR